MKDKLIQIKVAESFKNRLRKAAELRGVNMSQFVIESINEKIDKQNDIKHEMDKSVTYGV